MSRRAALLSLVAGSLAGCATIAKDASAIASDISLTASDAAMFYGIVKGIAEAAEIANPAIAPLITAGLVAMDALMVRIQAGSATTAEVTTLVAQAATITILAAPSVTVVPKTA